MKYSISRPETTDLAVSLFARSLHPELFEPYECYEHRSNSYRATIQLTSNGHTVEFNRGENFVTEVLDSKQALFPRIKRLCLYTIESNRRLSYQLDGGLNVSLCYECEYVAPGCYQQVEQEYWNAAKSSTLSHLEEGPEFNSSPCLSFVRVDAQKEALTVQGFHLYPEECAVVKSESRFSFA